MNKKRFLLIVSILMIFSIIFAGCSVKDSTKTAETTKKMVEENTKKIVEETKAKETEKVQEPADNGLNTKKSELLKTMMSEPIQDFEVLDMDGNKVKLSDYKGKIVFLNFWGSWCPPCRGEMPDMQKIHDKYKDEDVVILAISSTSVELRGGSSSEKAKEQVTEFIEKEGYTFPILFDPDDSAWAIYQQRGVPTNYVIDKEGIIRYGFSGAYSGDEQMEELIANIRAIE